MILLKRMLHKYIVARSDLDVLCCIYPHGWGWGASVCCKPTALKIYQAICVSNSDNSPFWSYVSNKWWVLNVKRCIYSLKCTASFSTVPVKEAVVYFCSMSIKQCQSSIRCIFFKYKIPCKKFLCCPNENYCRCAIIVHREGNMSPEEAPFYVHLILGAIETNSTCQGACVVWKFTVHNFGWCLKENQSPSNLWCHILSESAVLQNKFYRISLHAVHSSSLICCIFDKEATVDQDVWHLLKFNVYGSSIHKSSITAEGAMRNVNSCTVA